MWWSHIADAWSESSVFERRGALVAGAIALATVFACVEPLVDPEKSFNPTALVVEWAQWIIANLVAVGIIEQKRE